MVALKNNRQVSLEKNVFAALLGYVHLQIMCLDKQIIPGRADHQCAIQRNLFNEVISGFFGKTAKVIKGLIPKFKPAYNA
jgi:hypothetical protein